MAFGSTIETAAAKRIALQLAAQMPPARGDALVVLGELGALVRGYFVGEGHGCATKRGAQAVVLFPGEASRRRRASSKGKPSALPK